MSKLRSVLLAAAVVSVLAAPMAMAAKGDMTFGLNGGASLPLSDFKDFAKTGFGGGVFGDYWVHEQFGVGVNLGYVQNKGKDLPAGDSAKETIIEVEGHGKWMPPMKDSPVAPYVEAGAGLYRGKSEYTTAGATSDTTVNKFGFHVGAGVGYKASPAVTVGVGGSFHVVPNALEIDDPISGTTSKKSLQYIRVGVDVTFSTSGAK